MTNNDRLSSEHGFNFNFGYNLRQSLVNEGVPGKIMDDVYEIAYTQYGFEPPEWADFAAGWAAQASE